MIETCTNLSLPIWPIFPNVWKVVWKGPEDRRAAGSATGLEESGRSPERSGRRGLFRPAAYDGTSGRREKSAGHRRGPELRGAHDFAAGALGTKFR